jgi:hypothetical protein
MDAVTRYRLSIFPDLQFIRRPVSIPPEDGTLCLIDRGTADRADRYVAAIFKGGKWLRTNNVPLSPPPTYWTEMAPDA